MHPQGWTGRGTGCPCRTGTRRAEPGRHRSRGGVSRAGGGLAPALPADLAIPEFTGAACLLCRLPTLPLVFLPAPYPPSPLPRRGRGRFKVISCKGLRPLHPQGWTGRGTGCPCRTGASVGGGGTTRREPLSLRFCGKPRVQPRGCKGRSPLHKKTISLPLPAGKGAGGDGGKIKAKGRAERQPQPPSPPAEYHSDKVSQCRKRSNPGDARGEAPCIRKL